MKICTIIVAAGSGKRFGGKKQFYFIKGKPVFLLTLEKFLPFSERVVLVLPEEDLTRVRKILAERKRSKEKIILVPGGLNRCDSVKNGLDNLPEECECEIVCIHDGVRPFVKKNDILRCITQAQKYGAAICAVPVSDTVKLSKGTHFVDRTIDRRRVWLAQTPQVFRKKIILNAYRKFGNKIPADITDDSQLVELCGYRVKIVEGSISNIKITTKEDIE